VPFAIAPGDRHRAGAGERGLVVAESALQIPITSTDVAALPPARTH